MCDFNAYLIPALLALPTSMLVAYAGLIQLRQIWQTLGKHDEAINGQLDGRIREIVRDENSKLVRTPDNNRSIDAGS